MQNEEEYIFYYAQDIPNTLIENQIKYLFSKMELWMLHRPINFYA